MICTCFCFEIVFVFTFLLFYDSLSEFIHECLEVLHPYLATVELCKRIASVCFTFVVDTILFLHRNVAYKCYLLCFTLKERIILFWIIPGKAVNG